jgi:tetratricopeptide (TPR) repeat protein
MLTAAADRAAALGDDAGEAFARAMATYHRFNLGECSTREVEPLVLAALPLLERVGDHASLVHIWEVLGFTVANGRQQFADWEDASGRALEHARLAGQQRAGLFWLEVPLVMGPLPADEALRRLDAVLPEAPAPFSLANRAWLLAMLDRFDEAIPLALEANARQYELDGRRILEWRLAEIALMRGEREEAAARLRLLCEWFEEREQLPYLMLYLSILGRVLCALGRFDEAEALAIRSRELGDREESVVPWRQVQALVHAHRGEHAEAEEAAREAVDAVERTDGLNDQAAAWWDLAEVLQSAGRGAEAAAAFAEALERYERKKNIPMARRLRERIATEPGRTS